MANLKQILQSNNNKIATAINTQNKNIKDYIDAIKIKYDSNTKQIILFNEKGVESTIDATDFIKDGMIENVELTDENNLIITWNTDAGKSVTTIPFNDFIDIYTIDGEDTDTIDITASTNNNKHTVNAKIKNQSITNEHIAANAAIDKSKLANDVQESLKKANSAVQSLDGYAMIGNDTDSSDQNTIYGAKAYAKNLTEFSSSNSSIKITEYDVDIQADTAVKIRTTGTNSSVKFDTNHVKVPEPKEDDDAANKEYVDSKITDNIITEEKLNEKNYVTAEILEDSGKISLNTNWDKIQGKPEYFNTNWDSVQGKPNDIMTLNEYQEDINQITNNKEQIKTLSTNLYATNQKAEGAMTKAEAALTADINGKIQINGIEFPTMNNNNASINYSEEYGVAIYTPNGNITLSSPSTNYINLNGNIKLPSNYSILDENGNDRLNISLTNSEDSISIQSAREVCIQGANSTLILNDDKVFLGASAASYPVIELGSANGAMTYSQLEIKKFQFVGDHSSIILYDDNNNKYKIYVNTSGELTCEKITTT